MIILRRPGHAWPLLLAANRDEKVDRPWLPPAAHWADQPLVIGGLDTLAGGTWLALGRGVVAAILNRPGSLGPAAGKASRGALPIRAAAARSASEAALALAALDAEAWRPFNLVIADARAAFFLRGTGAGRPDLIEIGTGLTMVTAHDPNDMASPRIRRHLPRFSAAPPPDPARGDWAAWETLLADAEHGEAGIAEALRIPPLQGFGTVSASLMALGPAGERCWRFCPAAPGTAPFRDLALPGI
ncbi:NRDE family protein [Falsiroseomonas sp.]|uniref:NRDE family protein n=1 Tax=Falsiroseomonas sp. TaxID=2870721 RepID=UPI0027339AE0|nr:NRDE family protein [Falsiroseomonas sp.]MDP3417414.1 NRDE family protein [Falsiroseomonas sp.]